MKENDFFWIFNSNLSKYQATNSMEIHISFFIFIKKIQTEIYDVTKSFIIYHLITFYRLRIFQDIFFCFDVTYIKWLFSRVQRINYRKDWIYTNIFYSVMLIMNSNVKNDRINHSITQENYKTLCSYERAIVT